MQIKLAKVWGCRPSEVLKEPTDIVISALEFEKFLNDYESMMFQMARDERGNR